jgi:hypothetical protein
MMTKSPTTATPAGRQRRCSRVKSATRSNYDRYLGKGRGPRGGRLNRRWYDSHLTPVHDLLTSRRQRMFRHHCKVQDRGMGNDGRFADYTILMKTAVGMTMSSERKCTERSQANNQPQGNQPTKYLKHAQFHRLLCLGPHPVICQGPTRPARQALLGRHS